MKVSCSLSAFKGTFTNALDQAKRLGFEYIDLICIPGWNHIMPDKVADDPIKIADEVSAQLTERGLTAVALNCGIDNPHDRNDQNINKKRSREIKGLATFAEHLGVNVASFFPGPKWQSLERDPQEVLEHSIATFCECLNIGTAHGVKIIPEPHWNTQLETLQQLRDLCDAMPEVEFACDPSHLVCAGESASVWQEFYPRVVHAHLRDAQAEKLCVAWGQGHINRSWIQELADSGYNGYVAVEYLPNDDGFDEESIRKCASDIRDVTAHALQ